MAIIPEKLNFSLISFNFSIIFLIKDVMETPLYGGEPKVGFGWKYMRILSDWH